jgi:hypothetical protein
MTETYKEYNETGDRNIFEDIIDKMILDQVAGMNETFRTAISKLPKDRKRLAILSLLDKDRNLFTKIKDSISNESLSKLDHVKDTVLMLREYVKIAEVEKKKFGEVMTPLDLVKEMLATLPKEVWSNPDLKWLDPANGTGPFPIIVIYKLMKGLEKWQPNEELRYKHIIENMIYTCELQPKNMFLFLCTIDPRDEYDCNIYTGSFLDEGFDKHMKEVWDVDKFDIVIGNPPYQEQKEGFKKTQPIWNLFVKKSNKMLSDNGFMTLVHPSGWRSLDGGFKDVQDILKGNLIYLEMHDEKDGQDTFGAITSYDWYCYSKKSVKVTNIKEKSGNIVEVDLSEWDFIPTGNFDTFLKLLAKENDSKVEILHSSSAYETRKDWVSKVETEEFKYPCVYTIIKDGTVNLFWSSKLNGHIGIPKIIWSNGMASLPTIDIDGKYGLTQFAYAIVDDVNNLEFIKNCMDSEKFIELMKYCYMSSGNRFDRKVLSKFKKDFYNYI